MQVIQHHRFGNLRTLVVRGEPWFYGKDLAVALAYKKPRNAVAEWVKEQHRCEYEALEALVEGGPVPGPPSGMQPHAIWVNEAGMFSLVLGSKLEAAKAFKGWVCEDVLPSLRRHGRYVCPCVEVRSERQLHNAVVKHLRRYHETVHVSPGLGEIQVTEKAGWVVADRRLECWEKGYRKGQPDLIIHQRSGNFSGLVLELKSPTGRGILSAEQQEWLDAMRLAGYRACVCDNLQEATELIDDFLRNARVCCRHCGNSFKSQKTLGRHLEKMHPPAGSSRESS
jgi:prophage antirepressor-like protein